MWPVMEDSQVVDNEESVEICETVHIETNSACATRALFRLFKFQLKATFPLRISSNDQEVDSTHINHPIRRTSSLDTPCPVRIRTREEFDRAAPWRRRKKTDRCLESRLGWTGSAAPRRISGLGVFCESLGQFAKSTADDSP